MLGRAGHSKQREHLQRYGGMEAGVLLEVGLVGKGGLQVFADRLGGISSSPPTPYPYLSYFPSPSTSLVFCFSVGDAGPRRLGGPGCRGPCATFYLPSP